MTAQIQQMTRDRDEETAEVRHVQTVKLRLGGGTPIIRATEAIRRAGFETGGSFRFLPQSVEETGMLIAYGQEEEVDGRSHPGGLVQRIRREGAQGKTLAVQPADAGLEALGIDVESIDWDDPPEFDVWAGEGLIALDLNDPDIRTVTFIDEEESNNGSGESDE